MRAFGRIALEECRVYFTGGTTAVLLGWREATVDVDLRFIPELDELFRGIPEMKEHLKINIELAAPSDFIPEVPGWQDRCHFHYDPYSQALSKIERGHQQDLRDVESMLKSGLVKKQKLGELFNEIEPNLYKYPAIDPKSFSAAVNKVVEA